MRPIDADELKEYATIVDKVCYYGDGESFLAVSVDSIDDMPTLDVVEVVRCKDCKHRHSSEFCECRPDEAFCSDGERIDGDNSV